MKKTNMRSGFTMIELIFVIVVIGILSAVAIPKFVNVQDDAKVASEKSTIGAIRSAIGMLHGKAIIKNKDFAIKITGPDATSSTLKVTVTDELYPTSLSITDDAANASKTGETMAIPGAAAGSNADFITSSLASDGANNYNGTDGKGTLAAVLELDGRTDWKTGATENASGADGAYTTNGTYMKHTLEGPASQSTGVKDDDTINEFEIDSDGVWQYDAIVGTITYREGTNLAPLTYTADTQ